MKKTCLFLLFVGWSANAGTLVYVPEAQGYIDVDSNNFYPRVAPNVAIDPDTGRTILPGYNRARSGSVPMIQQAPAPVPVAPAAPVSFSCDQLKDRVDWLKGTLQYIGEHDPDYPAVYRNWLNNSQVYRRQCK